MFYYYGRKEKVFKYYPKPKYNTIIEPFAGSAVYSLKNFEKNIIILDKDERIINIWKYLKEASSADILSLPLLTIGQSLNDTQFDSLSFVQKDLISFFTNPSSAQPKRSVGKFHIWHEKNRKRLFRVRCIHGPTNTINIILFLESHFRISYGIFFIISCIFINKQIRIFQLWGSSPCKAPIQGI